MATLDRETRAFASLTGFAHWSFTLTGEGDPEALSGVVALPDHFAVLGVQPAQGRGFRANEHEVAVIRHGLWQRRFGGDAIVGRRIRLDDTLVTVVGVMPEAFEPLDDATQIWTPIPFASGSEEYRDMVLFRSFARLAPGATVAQAEAELTAVATSLRANDPSRFAETLAQVGVGSLADELLGGHRRVLMLMLGAVGLVLLVACTNVANLLLAKAAERRNELGLRTALGAGRWRLIRQLLTESVLLGLLGGAVGLAGAAWALELLTGQLPATMPRVDQIAIDARLLAFTFGVSLLTSLLFGLLPAVRAVRVDLFAATRGGESVRPGRHRLNQVLVGTETALAVVLVAGAGLLVRSLIQLQDVDLGFVPEGALTYRIEPGSQGRFEAEADRIAFHRRVAERVRQITGVAEAGLINLLPLSGGNIAVDYSTADHPPVPNEPAPYASVRMITPGYLASLRVPLVAGRALTSEDRADTEPVGLINAVFARRLWPDGDAVGRALRFGDGSPWLTIVGVIGDVRRQRLDLPDEPAVYMPYAQAAWSSGMSLVVRPEIAGTVTVDSIRRGIWSVDPNVAITSARPMESVIDGALRSHRFLALLTGGFASIALILGAIGIYGVTAFTVRQRTREIGIRMAVGASVEEIVRATMRSAMGPVAIGVLVGLAGAAAAYRMLGSLLYNVGPTDPAVAGGAVAALLASAGFACYVAARAAARVDPVRSLRTT